MINGERFTLNLKNQSSKFQKFAIFQTFYDVTESAVKPLPLAWIVGAAAPGHKDQPSGSEITWKTVCGVTLINSYHMGDGMLSSNSVQAPVSATGENGFAVTYFGDFPLGAPAFIGSIMDGQKGMLLIQSDGRIPSTDRQYSENCFLKVGFSMAGKQVSVADLHPNALYRFSLNPVYRVVVGEFYPGQVVADDCIEKSFVINFGGERRKTVILNGDDSFEDERQIERGILAN